MEGDMDDFVGGETYASDDEWEIDLDYEFDGATFFDFTRQETELETEEAQRWFDYADSYPPSPFLVKLNLEKMFSLKEKCSSSKSADVGTVNSSSSSNSGVGRVKLKKMEVSRSSTLMNPTLSRLAKQDKLEDEHLMRLIDRRKKSPPKKLDEKKLQSPSRNLAPKRQKLESGFLRKISQLKHQTLLMHKIVKKGVSPSSSSHQSKLKVTIPKEPQLETMQRAQRRRLKITSEAREDAKLKVHKYNLRRLNGKVHDVVSPENSAQRVPKNRAAKSKTLETEMQQSSLDENNTINLEECLKKDNCEVWANSDIRALGKKGSSISTDESRSQDLPIESFSKLSIKSGSDGNSVSQARLNKHNTERLEGLKENSPGSFKLDFRRCAAKPNQCGGDNMILGRGQNCRNVTRSFDIH